MAKPKSKNKRTVFQTESKQMASYVCNKLTDLTHQAFSVDEVSKVGRVMHHEVMAPVELSKKMLDALWALSETLAHYRVVKTDEERELGPRK